MTNELFGLPMQGQSCIAVRTDALPAAGFANQCGGKAASIEVNQNLAVCFQVRTDHPNQGIGEATAQTLAAKINRMVARHLCSTSSLREQNMLIAPTLSVIERFQRRRCTAENQGNVQLLRPLHGQISG